MQNRGLLCFEESGRELPELPDYWVFEYDIAGKEGGGE